MRYFPYPVVESLHLHLSDRQHATGTRSWVVHLPNHPGACQPLAVVDQEQGNDEADDLPRRVVLPGGLVGYLREAPDQVLEQIAHLEVRNCIGMQVDLREAVEDEIQQPGVIQALELIRE
jgi:hypothetical protein